MLPILLALSLTVQMGFDQDRAVHHFRLYSDGGAIEVATKDPGDTKERDLVRAHLSHLAAMFGDGDFEAPMMVHETKDVPGTAVLAARHDRLRYRYAESDAGARVDIVTTDPAALAALHDFLRYQIREHKTGDPVKSGSRR